MNKSMVEQTKKDGRYTVTLEWVGHPQQRYVVRFLGTYVINAVNERLAWELAAKHNANRLGVL
jgi:hypothetical protein